MGNQKTDWGGCIPPSWEHIVGKGLSTRTVIWPYPQSKPQLWAEKTPGPYLCLWKDTLHHLCLPTLTCAPPRPHLPAPPRDAAPPPIKRLAAAGGPYGALRTAGYLLRPRPLRVSVAPMRAAALLAALAVLAGAWLRAGRRRKGGCRCVCGALTALSVSPQPAEPLLHLSPTAPSLSGAAAQRSLSPRRAPTTRRRSTRRHRSRTSTWWGTWSEVSVGKGRGGA